MMVGAALLLLTSAAAVQGDGIRLEFDGQMRSRVVATAPTETALGPFTESETLLTDAGEVGGFALKDEAHDTVSDAFGEGQRTTLRGEAGSIVKEVEVTAYAARPRWLFVRVRYRNAGAAPLQVRGFTSHRYEFSPAADRREPAFWSYQSASYESRPDWVLPLGAGLPARQLPRHERLGLRRRHAGRGRLAPRRRPCDRPPRARAEARLVAGRAAEARRRASSRSP